MLTKQAVHGGHGNRGEQHTCKTHFLADMGQQAEQHKHGQRHHHKLDGADDEGVFACGLNVGTNQIATNHKNGQRRRAGGKHGQNTLYRLWQCGL